MIEQRQNFQKQLAALEAFMQTPAYSSFRATLLSDIQALETGMLHSAPTTEAAMREHLVNFGRLDERRSMLTFFEDACSSLKIDIERMLDVENQEGTNNKQPIKDNEDV